MNVAQYDYLNSSYSKLELGPVTNHAEAVGVMKHIIKALNADVKMSKFNLRHHSTQAKIFVEVMEEFRSEKTAMAIYVRDRLNDIIALIVDVTTVTHEVKSDMRIACEVYDNLSVLARRASARGILEKSVEMNRYAGMLNDMCVSMGLLVIQTNNIAEECWIESEKARNASNTILTQRETAVAKLELHGNNILDFDRVHNGTLDAVELATAALTELTELSGVTMDRTLPDALVLVEDVKQACSLVEMMYTDLRARCLRELEVVEKDCEAVDVCSENERLFKQQYTSFYNKYKSRYTVAVKDFARIREVISPILATGRELVSANMRSLNTPVSARCRR